MIFYLLIENISRMGYSDLEGYLLVFYKIK